jgi:hypothetical protein
MAKLTMPAEAAKALAVRERVLLFCAASGTDWLHAGVTGETVTAVMVKGLVERDAAAALALTDRGRAVLRAMLPDLRRPCHAVTPIGLCHLSDGSYAAW